MTLQSPPPAEADLAAAREAAGADALLAAGDFGRLLRSTPEFRRLVEASETLGADPEAKRAIDAYGRREASLRMETMLGTASDAQRAELDALQATMLACPSVAAYMAAETAFQAVCRETAAVVSAEIGVDFAANCRSGGCCG